MSRSSMPQREPWHTDRYSLNGRHLGFVEPIPKQLGGPSRGWYARDPFGDLLRNGCGAARVFQSPDDARAALRIAADDRDKERRARTMPPCS